jgi:2-polyprenyl-6-methoxyphenol hydroxylase-like FAD-dependent oxidoreductase
MQPFTIAVAGAGPAGLAAALALNRLGHKVTVFEQFEKPRPLGSGLILQPTGLGVLDWLGVGDEIRRLGARIDRLQGTSATTGRTVLDVRYSALGEDRGCAVHRAALFNVLFAAVTNAGVNIESSRRVSGFDAGALMFDNGVKTARFDVVVDALGARSPLRQFTQSTPRDRALEFGAVWATLPWPGLPFDPHALMQRYDKARVMIGVLPIGRVAADQPQQAAFFWSLKRNEVAGLHSAGIEIWKQQVLHYWPAVEPLLKNIQHTDELTIANYQHHTLTTPFGEKLVSIGDSAHSTSPQLGQGANNALLDVMALAFAMQKTTDIAAALKDYAKSRRNHVRLYQFLSLAFTPFYQSDSHVLPWLRDHVVANGSKIPLVQRILAKMVAGKLVAPIHPQ